MPHPGHTPGDLRFFLSWQSIPYPRAPDQPQIRFFGGKSFLSVKSKMRQFHNFYKCFPEFIERRIKTVM